MSELRHAARVALARRFAEGSGPIGSVDRISIDIAVDGRRELVSLALRGADLSWSCTCGQNECSHAHAALALLADSPPIAPVIEPVEAARQVQVTTDRRTVAYSQQAEGDTAALAETLRDLVTAVVRSGLTSGVSASIEEVLQRLIAAAPFPLPLGVSRFVGRLKKSIVDRDADEVARVLHGASLLADDLHPELSSEQGRVRVLSWLGSLGHDSAGVTRMTDLSLIEIAREWLPGVERAGVERRYMVDLDTGQIYREERAPAALEASLGPCPRQLTELLALVEHCAPPRRVRLLQYAVTPVIAAETWDQLAKWAVTDFTALAGTYSAALTDFAGLGEPFAMVAPAELEPDTTAMLRDARGHRLPLLCDDRLGIARCLRELSDGAELLWVAGRLLDRDGAVGLVPLSAAVRRHGRICYAQM
jgi:hypothetical protein